MQYLSSMRVSKRRSQDELLENSRALGGSAPAESGDDTLHVHAAALDPSIFGSLRELLDEPILKQTYSDFLANTRLRLQTFPAASEEKAVQEVAHSLRGTAAMLGANQISRAIAQLEREPASSARVARVVEQLFADCTTLEAALRKEGL